MEIKILAFGIAKDIFGTPAISLTFADGDNTAALKTQLENRYPRLKQLDSYMIAVNNEYARNDSLITEKDEVAIIPPVSGG